MERKIAKELEKDQVIADRQFLENELEEEEMRQKLLVEERMKKDNAWLEERVKEDKKEDEHLLKQSQKHDKEWLTTTVEREEKEEKTVLEKLEKQQMAKDKAYLEKESLRDYRARVRQLKRRELSQLVEAEKQRKELARLESEEI